MQMIAMVTAVAAAVPIAVNAIKYGFLAWVLSDEIRTNRYKELTSGNYGFKK